MRLPIIASLFIVPILAADLDFKEKFADPVTRSESLSTLIPETRDWYFYRALEHQLNGRNAECATVLEEWKQASQRRTSPVSAEGLELLENRALLLSYDQSPKETFAGIARKLNVEFNDPKPDRFADEAVPDTLATEAISRRAFEDEAGTQNHGKPWEGYTQSGLFRQMDKAESFSNEQRNWFFRYLNRADHPNTVRLIAAALGSEEIQRIDGQFPKIPLLDQLTLAQLQELHRLQPRLNADPVFVSSWLGALRPGDDVDLSRDVKAQAEYAARCLEVTKTLPPALARFHFAALAHHLRLQRELGQFPLDDFIAYLAIPRRGHPLIREADKSTDTLSSREASDFNKATGFPPIGGDEEIIRAYLDHFLSTGEASPFAPYFEPKRLATLQAEARLLSGKDRAKWGAMLEPSEFKELQESTQIVFAPGQPSLLPAASEVALSLDLKNTPQLLIRVYRLDLVGYLESHGTEPQIDLDLDGLVPTHEATLSYLQDPLVKHREVISLPELTGRGAWIVEAVSKGVAARALIRKGMLTPVIDEIPGGSEIRVIDETGAPVTDATVTFNGKTYEPGNTGRIFVPTPKSGRAVVRGGGIATVISLNGISRTPRLTARFHLDREQLLANQRATLQMRLHLQQGNVSQPLENLRDLALKLTAKLPGDITTERIISDEIKPLAQQTIDFLVPADATSLQLQVSAKVQVTQGEEPETVESSAEFAINETLKTELIGNALFVLSDNGYSLEVRGRNGEPVPRKTLAFEFFHADYTSPVKVNLRTNDAGGISLGHLAGIRSVKARAEGVAEAGLKPDEALHSIQLPRTLRVTTKDEIRLPLANSDEGLTRQRFALRSLSRYHSIRDFYDHLSLDQGALVLKALPPGSYRLFIDGFTVDLKILPGEQRDEFIVSPWNASLKSLPATPEIISTTFDQERLTIRLANHSKDTRVTVTGNRYLLRPLGYLQPFGKPLPRIIAKEPPLCRYRTDRRLPDEIRYILERRRTEAFPGVMLPRPGLLLHRWSDETSASTMSPLGLGMGGEDQQKGQMESSGRSDPFAGGAGSRSHGVDPSIDFLASTSTVRYDLEVNDDGTVTLPMSDFATSQSLRITVTDQEYWNEKVVPLSSSNPPLRDLRLLRPLDSDKHHIGTRGITTLNQGEDITIDNMLDADWRAFTTLENAWSYLAGALPDTSDQSELIGFAFLTKWPELDTATKLGFLSSHGCHELHLFLHRKDRAFFDQYVRPQLLEKQQPGFIDDYLLGHDLSAYLRPYAWQRLNAAEKALLSQAVPAARERIVTQLEQRWELEAPSADSDNRLFLATLRGESLALTDSLGLARSNASSRGSTVSITNKLRALVIPEINFEETPIEEAMDFLRQKSIELDKHELDPTKRGIKFKFRAGGQPLPLRVKQLRLRDVPISVALKYICDYTRTRYKVDESGVTLLPQMEVSEDLFNHTFDVPEDFLAKLEGGSSGDSGDSGDSGEGALDPFGSETPSPATLSARPPLAELLRNAGINFPEGASVQLVGGKLVVSNSPTELDKIESLVSSLDSADMSSDESVDHFSRPSEPTLAPPSDRSKIWREANYRKHRGNTGERMIGLNRFWIDLAAADPGAPFLSPHFNACVRSLNEALMALAVLDLPFSADKPNVRADGSRLQVHASSPMLLFYKDTRETSKVSESPSVLVRQTLHRLGEEARTEEGKRVENFLDDNLVAGDRYGMSLVVTNPGGDERRVDVLAQIPEGAIPLSGKPVTLSRTITIEPYGVTKLDLAFYFPLPGKFSLYPLHVSEGDTILAHTAKRTITVGAERPSPDGTSWTVLAQEGTDEAIFSRLRTDNLAILDLDQIRWRLHDRKFFEQTWSILQQRLHFDRGVASYGLLHGNVSVTRDYLENSSLASTTGDWFESSLLSVRPEIHKGFELLEFDPLVNARIHPLGNQPRLTNAQAHTFQEQVLDQLAWKPAIDDLDQLRLAYLLQLQDRTADCIARFTRIDPTKLNGRMAYDYLHCVILFAQEKPAAAAEIARGYLDHPLVLWRSRFEAVVAQADEIVSLASTRPGVSETDEPSEPVLDILSSADGNITLEHRHLSTISLKLFTVDLEVLFSKDPFLSGGSASLPPIQPNETLNVSLDSSARQTRVELPDAYRNGNVLVAADLGTRSVVKIIDSRAMEILRTTTDHTLQVIASESGRPLPKSYVKIYSVNAQGEPTFLKDGYTDLRGKFDYLSTTTDSDQAEGKLAVLVMHPEGGAKTLVFTP